MTTLAQRTRAAVLSELGSERPYAGSAALGVRNLELDAPGPGELLIKIKAAGVCHSDLSVVNGNRPRPVPMVLGHEAAGVVAAVGPNVQDVKPGAHVVLVFVPSCGVCPECVSGAPALCRAGAASNSAGELLRGGRRLHAGSSPVHHHLGVSAFSEYAVVDRSSAVVIDDDIPLETAALFGCMLLTGAGAVINTAHVGPGESVAVFGLGGVGLSAVMGAVVAGAAPILAIDPVEAKRKLALELGATAAFGPEVAADAIRDMLPQGVRYAFEAVGSEVVMAQAFDVTARGGTTVAVGLAHPSKQFAVSATQIVAEARTIVGSYMGSARPQRDLPMLIELWRRGRLPVEKVRGEAFPLEGVAAAFDALADGDALRQIVLP